MDIAILEHILPGTAAERTGMDFQPIINALPTLFGALIGAGVSIGTTMLSNRHADMVDERKRAADYKRKMEEQQIENYEKLQEAVLEYARGCVIEYIEIRDKYANGLTHAELRTDDERGELLRLSQVRYSILCDRVLSDNVRALAKDFNTAVDNMTLFARNYKELEAAFLEFGQATKALLDTIGIELRKLLASETSLAVQDEG